MASSLTPRAAAAVSAAAVAAAPSTAACMAELARLREEVQQMRIQGFASAHPHPHFPFPFPPPATARTGDAAAMERAFTMLSKTFFGAFAL